MISSTFERSLQAAMALARQHRHEYATLEHLLLALLDDEDAAIALRACRANLDALRTDVAGFVANDLARLALEITAGDPLPTSGFQRVVQRAASHVQSSGRGEVTGTDVLAALFAERESHAVYFLQLQGVTEGAVRAAGEAAPGPAQVFVALPPGPGARAGWGRGFAPAIYGAGHQMRTSSASLAGRITGLVLTEIRQSRLVVADHTDADSAVQFVAGFAAGLGITVIPTCHADGAAGFSANDSRYFDLLVWQSPEDLVVNLEDRVVAVLGRVSGASGDGSSRVEGSDALETTGAALQRLVSTGGKVGFVTRAELRAAVPEGHVSPEFIQDLLAWLRARGIVVVDDEG